MDEKIDLVSLPKKSFWKLSVPIIAFCIFTAVYSIVDMVWVSKISVEAFFALGISIPFVSLIFSFGDSIGLGTNSMMSRFIGSKDYESAYNTLIHGLILSHIMWVFVVICLYFAHGILFYLDKADSYILVFDYLVPIVIFAYVFIFINLFSQTLQAEGNSRLPTILIISSNILNLILDPIFIFNLNLGLKGAAYATVLSAFIVYLVFIYYYVSGRTKVPLSFKYFKFRLYIFVEILKVALPNFLKYGLWCFIGSFINSILVTTTGEIGPILFSVSSKLENLLIAPLRGYGGALMSVSGHLFGAHKFEELNGLYKYALKVSLITSLVVVTIFIFARDYVFSLFSITGMETEIMCIAAVGVVIIPTMAFSIICSKMLDSFGKSMYAFFITVISMIIEIFLIYELYVLWNSGMCVLIGTMIGELILAACLYLFVRYLFKNFDDEYADKTTVKTFDKNNNSSNMSKEENMDIDEDKTHENLSQILLIIALIALSALLIEIISIPFRVQNYQMVMSGAIAFVIGGFSVYLIERLDKSLLPAIGFLLNGILIFVFMQKHGYISTILFVLAGLLAIYINLIVKKLK